MTTATPPNNTVDDLCPVGIEDDDVEATGPDRTARWRRRAVEWTLLAIAPVVVIVVYGVERFYQLSGADPFIYTGCASSTADLIERLGYP